MRATAKRPSSMRRDSGVGSFVAGWTVDRAWWGGHGGFFFFLLSQCNALIAEAFSQLASHARALNQGRKGGSRCAYDNVF